MEAATMEAKTKTRRHLSAQAWQEVFGRFDASGESVTGFCRREGLHTSSFNRWRQRLSDPATVQAKTSGKASGQAPAAGFIDVGSMVSAARPESARLEIRLDLGGGVVLQLVRG
jgi:hypothetical protein